MTQENKKHSNPDYTASAVQLTNPPEVKGLLDEWLAAVKVRDEVRYQYEKELEALPLYGKDREARALVDEARKNLEVTIKEFGGYQDMEQGLYALQQVRRTLIYDPELVLRHIPEYADKILGQVDIDVLKGLLTGKLITQEQVERCSTAKESFRFVIEALL